MRAQLSGGKRNLNMRGNRNCNYYLFGVCCTINGWMRHETKLMRENKVFCPHIAFCFGVKLELLSAKHLEFNLPCLLNYPSCSPHLSLKKILDKLKMGQTLTF
ncbi:hypothetical protein GOODEAATRI_027734 [Goodea atripinnis]|uniref:Uncharacterized protein n=1 Tax=Goodea atripinnis TaxID=208336 RepID=A0ABV0NYD0_9TELE